MPFRPLYRNYSILKFNLKFVVTVSVAEAGYIWRYSSSILLKILASTKARANFFIAPTPRLIHSLNSKIPFIRSSAPMAKAREWLRGLMSFPDFSYKKCWFLLNMKIFFYTFQMNFLEGNKVWGRKRFFRSLHFLWTMAKNGFIISVGFT